ncbi:hypothetical protein ACJQWK_04048 [Exserohilum turcicum]
MPKSYWNPDTSRRLDPGRLGRLAQLSSFSTYPIQAEGTISTLQQHALSISCFCTRPPVLGRSECYMYTRHVTAALAYHHDMGNYQKANLGPLMRTRMERGTAKGGFPTLY